MTRAITKHQTDTELAGDLIAEHFPKYGYVVILYEKIDTASCIASNLEDHTMLSAYLREVADIVDARIKSGWTPESGDVN